MLKKALILSGALVAALAISSCVAQTRPDQPKTRAGTTINFKVSERDRPDDAKAGKCKQGFAQCLVYVVPKAGKPCATIDPEYLVIGENKPITLIWQVQSKDWSFDEKTGVSFYAPDGHFDNGVRDPSDPAKFGIRFTGKAKKHQYFGYEVNLVGPKGATCRVDPGVVTEWP